MIYSILRLAIIYLEIKIVRLIGDIIVALTKISIVPSK